MTPPPNFYSLSRKPFRALAAVLIAGIAAGTMDVLIASFIFNASPLVILRAIASGVLGKESFQGGMYTSWIGLGLQWLISVIAATIYVIAGQWLPSPLRQPILIGPLFGAGVFAVMRAIVVPLSKANPALPSTERLVEDFAANMLFGLIIAITTSWLLRRRNGD